MPVNPNTCNTDVKSSCFPCHSSYHRKCSVFKTGAFLNQYEKTDDDYSSDKFEGRKKYIVCFNLWCLFNTAITKQMKKKQPKEPEILEVSSPTITLGLANVENWSTRRMKQAILRDGIVDENSFKKTDKSQYQMWQHNLWWVNTYKVQEVRWEREVCWQIGELVLSV